MSLFRSFKCGSSSLKLAAVLKGCRTISSFYQEMYQQSITNPEKFWEEQAYKYVTWRRPFDNVMRCDLKRGLVSFYNGGQLNVCENCVDRHLPKRANQVALHWEKDAIGDTEDITYQQLYENVCQFANALKRRGVKRGDVVTIYMPMCPHAIYAMLACARIGAPHSLVFAGFSAEALASRMQDANSKVLITADEGYRGGKTVPLKVTADQAVARLPKGLCKTMFVYQRTGGKVSMESGRDIVMQQAMKLEKPTCPAEPMNAEDMLFLLYTSGSTGKPKGLEHCTGGYLTYAAMTHKLIFDIREGDVFGCMADIGWVTGHSYIVYGPLCNGVTSVVFESIPTYPDPGRYWEMVQRTKITQFYTAPTAIRLLMTSGNSFVTKYDRSSLRVLGSVGEPINPEAWKWYNEVVGEKRCAIVDTWWQTETGGIMITPLATCKDQKPGAAMRPFFGVQPVLLDEKGTELSGNGVSGVLAIKQAVPGMARSIYGDFDRFLDTYYRPFSGYYFTGDGATRDADGHIWITGRVDDVINVSGHRLGTAEVEAALTTHPSVAEAAVVGFPHDVKGEGIYAYVILKEGYKATDKTSTELKNVVRKEIGAWATPDFVHVTVGLPKTRSGKIMRRILRKIAAQQTDEIGDVSTLAEPAVVQDLIKARSALK